MRDRTPGITRERVKGGAGTRIYPTGFSVLLGHRQSWRERLFFWGDIMSNPSYRAERCRDLAEEYRAIAALCAASTEMRTHYLRMSDHYSRLADAEELGTLLAASTIPT
jgi:hypothetical protein